MAVKGFTSSWLHFTASGYLIGVKDVSLVVILFEVGSSESYIDPSAITSP